MKQNIIYVGLDVDVLSWRPHDREPDYPNRGETFPQVIVDLLDHHRILEVLLASCSQQGFYDHCWGLLDPV